MDIKKEEWDFKFKEWKEIPLDVIKFYFNQAEKSLDETMKTFESTAKKSQQILAICITIITVSLKYLIATEANIEFRGISFFTFLTGVIIIIQLRKNLFYNTRIGVKGGSPSITINKKLLLKDFSNEEKYINTVLSECIKYQKRIDNNKRVNNSRSIRLRVSLFLFFLLPISIVFGKILSYPLVKIIIL